LTWTLSGCGSSQHSSTVKVPPPAVIPGRPQPVEETYRGCAPWGSGGEDPFINQLKNRIDRPVHPVTLSFAQMELLDWPPGVVDVPTTRWPAGARAHVFQHDGMPVSFVGYLSSADAAGSEPTNCGTRAGVDWHVWLGAVPHAPHILTFIAETTGRVRARESGFDLHRLQSLAAQGDKVRITGWLMLDSEHPEQPNNRATIWEIHPVTAIEVWAGSHWQRVAASSSHARSPRR
jgi:hypothetical protein